ncbi:MAG TPA: hypothetical protein VIU40_00885, partial [Geobacteraceae bacterium]
MNGLGSTIATHFGQAAVRETGQFPDTVPLLTIPCDAFEEAARIMKVAGARLAAQWGVDETT